MSQTLNVAPEFINIAEGLRVRASQALAGAERWTVTQVSQLAGGHSGFTYLVQTVEPERQLVLRLSPPNARITGPSDVGRQGQIMAAVTKAGIPVPRVLDYSSDPVIDGRAFVLMEWVDGVSWNLTSLSHPEVAAQAAQLARRIGEVAPEVSGLAGDAPLSPMAELDRWAALLARCPSPLQAAIVPVLSRLADAAPEPGRPGLVHGDFHYGNLMFNGGQITAVVDWEIASLGEPLFDLGSLAVASLRRRYAPEPNPTGSIEVSVGDLASLYGVDTGRFGWFAAASCLKYAVILGYNYELHRRGKRIDPIYDALQVTTRGLVDDAASLLDAA